MAEMIAMNAVSDRVPAEQQAAPAAALPSYLPEMSAPPDYAPPVITPLRQLRRKAGPDPEWINCPFCERTTTIRRVAEPSDEAKCCILCCCLLGLLIPCLLDSGDWWENIDIHCMSCNKHLVTITPDEEVQIVRPANRPPLPTAAQTQRRQQQQQSNSPPAIPGL